MITTKFSTREITKLGAVHTPELDFSDDGTRFRMYSYKGLPICYAKVDGEHYLSIRFDYIDGLSFNDYKEFATYEKSNEFNGCSDTDMDVEKLQSNVDDCYNELVERGIL